jgi:beta-galactosidase
LSDPGGVLGPHPVTGLGPVTVAVTVTREAGRAVPVSYGKFDGRQSAPAADAFDELAAVYAVELPAWVSGADALLRIGWAGDVGQLRVDGRTVTDRFWDGSEWIVSLRDAGYRAGSRVSLHLLPLAAGSTVSLTADARERLALDYVRVVERLRFQEPS